MIFRHDGVNYHVGPNIQELGGERADFYGNGRVDLSDFLKFARAYGKSLGQTG